MLLKRQAFAVFSGELDQYHLYLPLIQGKTPPNPRPVGPQVAAAEWPSVTHEYAAGPMADELRKCNGKSETLILKISYCNAINLY